MTEAQKETAFRLGLHQMTHYKMGELVRTMLEGCPQLNQNCKSPSKCEFCTRSFFVEIPEGKVGMTLYDVRKNNWRNNLRGESPFVYWPVYVQTVDAEKREVLASWNGNLAKWLSEKQVTKYRVTLPKKK